MIFPLPHDSERPRRHALVAAREVRLAWATVALQHMQAAESDRRDAMAAGDEAAQDDATDRILDARSVYMEWI